MKPIIKGAFVITGATGSIGSELAIALARTKKPIVLACRNMEKGTQLRRNIINSTGNHQIFVRPLCLESLVSIKDFVTDIEEDGISIYALINNAGVMLRNYTLTKDKREMTFAVNYTGTLMLTALLMPLIEKGGHVIFTTSLTRRLHHVGNININEPKENFSQLGTYGRSKNALTHFAMYLAHCYQDVYINCLDPGIVNSGMITMQRWYDPLANMLFRPMVRTAKSGAKPTLKALLLKTSGNIITNRSIHPINYDSYDVAHGHLIEETKQYLLSKGIVL